MIFTEGVQTDPTTEQVLATGSVAATDRYRLSVYVSASASGVARFGISPGPVESDRAIRIDFNAAEPQRLELGEHLLDSGADFTLYIEAGLSSGKVVGCVILERA